VRGIKWAQKRDDVSLCGAGLPEGTEPGMLIDHLKLQEERKCMLTLL